MAQFLLYLCCYLCCERVLEQMMRIKAKSVAARAIRMATLLCGVVLLLGAVSPVSADTIGVAVTGLGSSTAAGLVPAADGTISFYIPLTVTASGDYGVKGTTVDTCSSPTTCKGGYLDMYL